MCGLVGFVTPSMSYSQGIQTISEMSSSLHHRGPDKSGYWHDSATNLFLSHTRLSILDTTLSGCQPMKSHCGRYSIVYNGEIYNHKELKNDILAKNSNHSFVGHSDTEVFLAYISIFGLNLALSRAIGMFAFALYDLNLQILFLCRDRFGEKPLYYGFQRQSLMFASELKALGNILTSKRNYLIKEVLFILNMDIFQHHILSMIIFIRLSLVPIKFFGSIPRLYLLIFNLSILTGLPQFRLLQPL